MPRRFQRMLYESKRDLHKEFFRRDNTLLFPQRPVSTCSNACTNKTKEIHRCFLEQIKKNNKPSLDGRVRTMRSIPQNSYLKHSKQYKPFLTRYRPTFLPIEGQSMKSHRTVQGCIGRCALLTLMETLTQIQVRVCGDAASIHNRLALYYRCSKLAEKLLYLLI